MSQCTKQVSWAKENITSLSKISKNLKVALRKFEFLSTCINLPKIFVFKICVLIETSWLSLVKKDKSWKFKFFSQSSVVNENKSSEYSFMSFIGADESAENVYAWFGFNSNSPKFCCFVKIISGLKIPRIIPEKH